MNNDTTKQISELEKRLTKLEKDKKDNFLIFGSSYSLVGDSSSDFLIKTRGKIKILWGNKFIDLLKDGKINVDSKFLFTSEGNKDGIYAIDDEVYLQINGEKIPLKTNDVGTTYVSFLEGQETDADSKHNALVNIGFLYPNLESFNDTSLLNGIIYVESELKLYIVTNGELTEYTFKFPNPFTELFILLKDDNSIGSIYIKGSGINNSLAFDGLYIYTEGSLSIINSNNPVSIVVDNKTIVDFRFDLTKFNNTVVSNKFLSDGATYNSGFRLYVQGGQSYLEVDNLIVRNKNDTENLPTLYSEYWLLKNNIITNADYFENSEEDEEETLDTTKLELTLSLDIEFKENDLLFFYLNIENDDEEDEETSNIKKVSCKITSVKGESIIIDCSEQVDDLDFLKGLFIYLYNTKDDEGNLKFPLHIQENNLETVDYSEEEPKVINRIGDLKPLNLETCKYDDAGNETDEPVNSYGTFSLKAIFLDAAYTKDKVIKKLDNSSTLTTTHWTLNRIKDLRLDMGDETLKLMINDADDPSEKLTEISRIDISKLYKDFWTIKGEVKRKSDGTAEIILYLKDRNEPSGVHDSEFTLTFDVSDLVDDKASGVFVDLVLDLINTEDDSDKSVEAILARVNNLLNDMQSEIDGLKASGGGGGSGEEIDLSSYATKTWVTTKLTNTLKSYVKTSDLEANYYNKDEIDDLIEDIYNVLLSTTSVLFKETGLKVTVTAEVYKNNELLPYMNWTFLTFPMADGRNDVAGFITDGIFLLWLGSNGTSSFDLTCFKLETTNFEFPIKILIGSKVYTKYVYINTIQEGADLSDYYNKEEVDLKIVEIGTGGEINLDGYATLEWVESLGYLTECADLTNYYTRTEVDNLIVNIGSGGSVDLSGYATEDWVKEQGYLTESRPSYFIGTDITWDGKEVTNNTTDEFLENDIYLNTNSKDLFIYISGKWNYSCTFSGESGGNIDLSNYVTREELASFVDYDVFFSTNNIIFEEGIYNLTLSVEVEVYKNNELLKHSLLAVLPDEWCIDKIISGYDGDEVQGHIFKSLNCIKASNIIFLYNPVYDTESTFDTFVDVYIQINVGRDSDSLLIKRYTSRKICLKTRNVLGDYYNKKEVDTLVSKIGSGGTIDLSEYATELWVKNQGYLTECPGYTKEEMDAILPFTLELSKENIVIDSNSDVLSETVLAKVYYKNKELLNLNPETTTDERLYPFWHITSATKEDGTEISNYDTSISGLSITRTTNKEFYFHVKKGATLNNVQINITVKIYITSEQTLELYRTIYINTSNTSNTSVNLSNYYTRTEVDNIISNINVSSYDDTELRNRVTVLENIDHSQFLTEHLDLSNYYTKTEVDTTNNTLDSSIEALQKEIELLKCGSSDNNIVLASGIISIGSNTKPDFTYVSGKLKFNNSKIDGGLLYFETYKDGYQVDITSVVANQNTSMQTTDEAIITGKGKGASWLETRWGMADVSAGKQYVKIREYHLRDDANHSWESSYYAGEYSINKISIIITGYLIKK